VEKEGGGERGSGTDEKVFSSVLSVYCKRWSMQPVGGGLPAAAWPPSGRRPAQKVVEVGRLTSGDDEAGRKRPASVAFQ